MVSALLAAALIRPLSFPAEPIPDEVARGEAVYRAGKGVDRLLMEDRVVIGRWFDGRVKRDVETVTWVSPNLVSRWLGYLSAREKWSSSEFSSRWDLISRRLDGVVSLVVQVSAFPKLDPLGVEAGSPARASSPMRFLVTYPSVPLGRLEPRVRPLGTLLARDWRPLLEQRWFLLSPVFSPLVPEFDCFSAYDWMFGEYSTSLFLVEVPVVEGLEKGFEVRVFSPGKERVGEFKL